MSNFAPEPVIQAAIKSRTPARFLSLLFQKSMRAAQPNVSEEEVIRAGIHFMAGISALFDVMMIAVDLEDDTSVAVLSSIQNDIHSFHQALVNDLAGSVKH